MNIKNAFDWLNRRLTQAVESVNLKIHYINKNYPNRNTRRK